METVKYSLNNEKYIISHYNKFDKNNITEDTFNNTKQKINNNITEQNFNNNITEQKTNNIIEQNFNNTYLFDKHCIEFYGEKTCILFHLDLSTIEIRLLDKIKYNKDYQTTYIDKKLLYNEIPSLLKKNYTVVLIEYIPNTKTNEITSIHLPPK